MTSTANPPTAMSAAVDPLDACGCDAGALATRATAVGADGTLGPPFDHLALLVTAQERWLTDVGWGDQFVRPLRVDGSGVQSDGRTTYRITATHADRILARRHADSTWEPLYHFTLDAHPLAAFGPTCRYHQSAPEAPFTQRRASRRPRRSHVVRPARRRRRARCVGPWPGLQAPSPRASCARQRRCRRRA